MPRHAAHRQAIHPGDDPQPLIERGWVAAQPITYEDFLPVSAAGIFQSNLGNETQARNHGNATLLNFTKARGMRALFLPRKQHRLFQCFKAGLA